MYDEKKPQSEDERDIRSIVYIYLYKVPIIRSRSLFSRETVYTAIHRARLVQDDDRRKTITTDRLLRQFLPGIVLQKDCFSGSLPIVLKISFSYTNINCAR